MNAIEKIKFVLGIILILYPVIGGFIFFLEGFGLLSETLDYAAISDVFDENTTLFLGLCGIGGAILINSIKAKD